MPKPQQYITKISDNLRIRTIMEFTANTVSHWAVQLEIEIPNVGWEWVVRYDTAGGEVHRDRSLIAQHEPVVLPSLPPLAIKAAQNDILQQVMLYAEAYLSVRKLK